MSSISNFLPSPPDGFSTTLSSSITGSTLTIPLNMVSGLGTEGVGVLYKKETDGSVKSGSVEYIHWTNISGNNLLLSDTGDRGITGSSSGSQSYSSGDIFEVWVTSYYYSSIKNGISTDGTFASNSDAKIPTEKASKTYIASYVTTVLQAVYPVGSVYFNASVSTNPATLLGFGTWTAWGSGRVPVGVDAGQTEFDTLEETGGAKTHTLSISEIPSHNHGGGNHTHGVNDPGHAHTVPFSYGDQDGSSSNGSVNGGATSTSSSGTGIYLSYSGDTISYQGSGSSHNNLQPYITVYMWKRTE